MLQRKSAIEMVVVTDPAELAQSRELREKFERNWRWYQSHIEEIGETCRGKAICVAGEKLFTADSPEEAVALARATHPDDKGLLSHYIPREKRARVYTLPREASQSD